MPNPKPTTLFNGKNFKGWHGDTIKNWRIENGVLVGGSITEMVPHNQFLSTRKSYTNYILKLKYKVVAVEGIINGGVQFHSQHISNPAYEMAGYQADIGNGVWGSLYDESRRNKMLATADPEKVKRLLKRHDWNDYEVRTAGGQVQILLNGEPTVDYTESDTTIPQTGLIALQVHGGGKVEIYYKDVVIQKIPRNKSWK